MSNTPTSSAQVAEGMNMEAERAEFEAWASNHLGQGYPLTMDEHVYEHPVTRWAFKAWQAARRAAQVAEGVALPPLPQPAHRGPDGTGSYFDSYTAEQVRQAQREARSAVELDLGLAKLAGDQLRDRLASADARIEELERELATIKGEHATQLATKSIDTPEFRRLVDATGNPNLDHHSTLTALIAYIDGRTAGPAVPEGYVIVPIGSTMEMDDAGHDTLLGRGANVEINDAEACWSAMIAAAPKPQEDA